MARFTAHKHKIFIAGNHERSFEHMPQTAHPLIASPIYFEDSAVDIDGVKFYGAPWQPEFYDWAFNLPRGLALAEKWALIPDETDILITHAQRMARSKTHLAIMSGAKTCGTGLPSLGTCGFMLLDICIVRTASRVVTDYYRLTPRFATTPISPREPVVGDSEKGQQPLCAL